MNLLPITVPLLPIRIYTNTAWPDSDSIHPSLIMSCWVLSLSFLLLCGHIYTKEQFCPYGRAGWLAGAEKSQRFMQGKGRQSSGTNKCVRSMEHLKVHKHEIILNFF
jgi:hypothetical protein